MRSHYLLLAFTEGFVDSQQGKSQQLLSRRLTRTTLKMKKIAFLALLLFAIAALPLRSVSAETSDNIVLTESSHNRCDIPESGPWPECATGEIDDCIIPDKGPWPPCATGITDETTSDACIIPERGPWPPCATGADEAATIDECVIPESGPWPPCATEPKITTDADITARVNVAVDQLNGYWQSELGWRGAEVLEPEHFELYWGSTGDVPNAYYVPDLSAIFIDVRLLQEVVDQFGDFAAVAVVAHEWGHFAQDALGILDLSRPRRLLELQADCFTGSFTRHLNIIGALNDGEYDSAGNLFFASGDDQLSPDTHVPAPNQHGTGNERRTAYDLGWENGLQTCIESY